MKKAFLILASLLCTLSVGCTNTKVEKSPSLKEAYFTLETKLSKEEKLSETYIKNLLKGYNYKKNDEFRLENGNTDGSDYVQQPYEFTNKNETLILTHSNFNKIESIEALYTIKTDNSETALAYTPPLKMEGLSDENIVPTPYMFTNVTDNESLHKSLSSKLKKGNNEIDKLYHEISNCILNSKNIDIETIKKTMKSEPTINNSKTETENLPKLDLVEYIFENDNESLFVTYIKDKNKVASVFYNDKINSIIKTTVDKITLYNEEKLHTGIITHLSNINTQKYLLNITSK